MAGLTDSVPGSPVPEIATLVGEFVALLTIEMFPLTGPAAVGANVTPRLTVWPAANVTGREGPLKLNCGFEIVICETVTAAVPVFLMTTGSVLRMPIPTLPKAVEAGLADNNSVTPTPDNGTVCGEFVAVLSIERVPVSAPVVVGVKITLRVVLWPASRITVEKLLIRKLTPVTVAFKSVIGAIPVLVRVMPCVLELFKVTLPKLRLLGVTLPDAIPCAEALTEHKNKLRHTTGSRDFLSPYIVS